MGRRAAGGGGSLKLRLVSVGRDKGPTAELADEYAKRLRRFTELELVELKASDPRREAEQLLSRARGELWALDQRGSEVSSRELAQRVGSIAQVTLCIGGDEGLADEVRSGARFVWSLSRLTLPHRLARVLVLEQLYRAFEILRGGPYHK